MDPAELKCGFSGYVENKIKTSLFISVLLGPSIMRSSMASQGGPKKDAKNSEPVGPGGSTPVQRQPNLGARPLPQGEQVHK